jgi:hypothetical protein
VAAVEGIAISQLVEKISVESVGLAYQQPVTPVVVPEVAEPQRKGSIFDLNRDVKKKNA